MSFKLGTTSAPSTGGFGVTQSPATGLFGSSTQPSTNQFGSTAFGNQQQSSMGFGAASQPISAAAFGSQPAGTNTATATVATPAFGSSSFGNAAKPAFGFGTNTTQQSTGFQSQPAQTANIFGQSTVQPTMGQSQFPQAQNQLPIEPHLAEYIQHLEGCWNPNSPSCQFKHYFYNMVHPSEVSLYGPQPGEDPVLYEQACQDNPDPTCLVPVLATGFSGLKTRLATQEEQVKTHKEKVEEFQVRLEELRKKHTVETSVKIEAYQRKQRLIVHQIFSLMKSVQILRNRGFSLRAEEETLITRLLAMDRDLAKPSVFRGRLNEIWAHIQQLKDADRLNGGRQFLTVIGSDDSDLKPLSLTEIGRGLGQLTKVIQEDSSSLDNIMRSYEEHSSIY